MNHLSWSLNRLLAVFTAAVLCLVFAGSTSIANEVLEETTTRVVVRDHPKTGKPFVSIVRPDANLVSGLRQQLHVVSRPDYRMLDPKINTKHIPYDGPVSDRRKIYIFAGTLAALGAGAGVYGALAPAATSGASGAGGAGLYAGGAVLTGGGSIVASIAAQTDNRPEDFKMSAESRENPPQ